MARPALRVLVVEPDDSVRTFITWHLEAAGFAVRAASGGNPLDALSTGPSPQLLIVAADVDAVGGIEVLRWVRAASTTLDPAVPVIVTSARPSARERVAAFEQGADDYIATPVGPEELEARARSLLRRATPAAAGTRVVAGPQVAVGSLRIDPAARTVSVAGRRIELTALEFDLLHFFAARPGQVFSRAQLLRWVWRPGAGHRDTSNAVSAATVTELVHRLRRKLGAEVVATVRGVGYRLDAPAPSDMPKAP